MRAYNILIISFLYFPLLAYAQGSSAGNIDLTGCASIPEDSARLACYDGLTREVMSHPAQQAGISSGVLQGNKRIREEITRLRNEQEHGRTMSSNPDDVGQDERYVIERNDGERELVGRIANLASGPSGWIVTLEQGQVWRQMINKRYDLRKGQAVRIYPTGWGDAYRLAAENNSGFIQVERIR